MHCFGYGSVHQNGQNQWMRQELLLNLQIKAAQLLCIRNCLFSLEALMPTHECFSCLRVDFITGDHKSDRLICEKVGDSGLDSHVFCMERHMTTLNALD